MAPRTKKTVNRKTRATASATANSTSTGPVQEGCYEVENITNFILSGPNMEQMYKIHFSGPLREVELVEATGISASTICFYWLKTYMELIEIKRLEEAGRKLRSWQKTRRDEGILAIQNKEKLKNAGKKLMLGYDQKKLPYLLKRYENRLKNEHKNPFGNELDPGEEDYEASSDEEDLDPTPEDLARRAEQRKQEGSGSSDAADDCFNKMVKLAINRRAPEVRRRAHSAGM